MSSIAGTINSINSSLLTEIQSFPNAKTGANTNIDPANATSDRIDFSQVGNLFKQLRELQKTDPAEFKQVLTEAVAKLKDAAGQQTDPRAADILNNLADRFQQAADTGDLSVLHPQSPSGVGRAHGHGGHHGHRPANDDDADDGTSTSLNSNPANPSTNQSLFALLNSYTNSPDQSPFTALLSGQSGQNGSSPESVLAQILGAGQRGSNSTQIQSLLASFVTTNNGSV